MLHKFLELINYVTGKTIIIGAGHAGGSTAGFLRNKKYAGEIVLIGQENHYPYQRPPLSKDFLTKAIEDKLSLIHI